MLRGELYVAADPELVQARIRARRLASRFNGSDAGDASGSTSWHLVVGTQVMFRAEPVFSVGGEEIVR
jgi:hypothetical protein